MGRLVKIRVIQIFNTQSRFDVILADLLLGMTEGQSTALIGDPKRKAIYLHLVIFQNNSDFQPCNFLGARITF
jgi:hypothetical protein